VCIRCYFNHRISEKENEKFSVINFVPFNFSVAHACFNDKSEEREKFSPENNLEFCFSRQHQQQKQQ
jgi:hypothetical protein